MHCGISKGSLQHTQQGLVPISTVPPPMSATLQAVVHVPWRVTQSQFGGVWGASVGGSNHQNGNLCSLILVKCLTGPLNTRQLKQTGSMVNYLSFTSKENVLRFHSGNKKISLWNSNLQILEKHSEYMNFGTLSR